MSRKTWMLLFPLVGFVGCDTVDDDLDEAVEAAESEDQRGEPAEGASGDLQAPRQVSEGAAPPSTQLVSAAEKWDYLPQSTCQPQYNLDWTTGPVPANWQEGRAELGYGDYDEQTEIPFGPSQKQKCITQYFRHSFTVYPGDEYLYESLIVHLLRDDGAAVYLNGYLIVRSNLPEYFDAHTLASYPTDHEDRFFEYNDIANKLVPGSNVIAVEVHQASKSSDDLSFNLQLLGVLKATPPPGTNRLTARFASKEATIDEAYPNTKFGLDSRCKVDGSSDDYDNDQACLARWMLPDYLPAGATIRAVHLDTKVVNSSSDRYQVYPITAGPPAPNWVEEKVTWNDSNTSNYDDWVGGKFGPMNLLYPVNAFNARSTGRKLIPLPNWLVEGWINTPGSNQGLALFNTKSENGIHFAAGDEGLELVVTYDYGPMPIP